MSTIDGVDPKTYARCKEYLESTMVQPNDEWADVPMSEEDDPNVQYQQYVLDRERDAEDERDMRNAPSEGPFTYDNLSST
jgi:hypothetical protein